MIRTTKTTFEQEEQNTEFFLKKLKEIKQKSKNIKTRNVIILHKSLFVSDWQYFRKIEYFLFNFHCKWFFQNKYHYFHESNAWKNRQVIFFFYIFSYFLFF